jgi:hypothetical protein
MQKQTFSSIRARIGRLLFLPLLVFMAGCHFSPDVAPGASSVAGRLGGAGEDGMSTPDSLLYVHEDTDPSASASIAVTGVTSATATSRILSGVKFAPQVPPGLWALTMSCGPASLNLICAYLFGATPDQVTYIRLIDKYLHKTDIDNCLSGGTSTTDLVAAAKAVNGCPNTYKASGWTLPRLRQEIDAGHAVVVAVRAGLLPTRGYPYAGNHFVAVVGYDASNIICHDVGTSRGAFKPYPNANFANAMASCGGAVVVPLR